MSEDRSPRYQLLQILLSSTVTLAIGIAGTAWFGDWFKSRLFEPSLNNSTVSIERALLYAKILFFRDRKLGEPHMIERMLHLRGDTLDNLPGELLSEKLYDEAYYLKAYHLRNHHPDQLHLESHSSGITDVIPLVPADASFEAHEYQMSSFQRLKYSIPVRGLYDVLVAHEYYNGFQYNEKRKRYESDGGFHFPYAVDEAVVIFDFSALTNVNQDNSFRLKTGPKLWLRRSQNESPSPLDSKFVNGILTSSTIKNVPEGAFIYCDWEWETEKQ